MLDNLNGNSWFSVLDQGKAHHQGFMSSNSQPLTAFITAWRIPKSYGELFERLERYCLCTYLDDIIIISATFEDHIENTPKVLRRLKEYGVKLKPRKCKLFKGEVTFLAHIVSEEG